MADFEPEFAYSHFFPCETFVPSLFLLRKVWPKLDSWLDVYFECFVIIKRVKQNLAAKAFLKLVEKLHIVFLKVNHVILFE